MKTTATERMRVPRLSRSVSMLHGAGDVSLDSTGHQTHGIGFVDLSQALHCPAAQFPKIRRTTNS